LERAGSIFERNNVPKSSQMSKLAIKFVGGQQRAALRINSNRRVFGPVVKEYPDAIAKNLPMQMPDEQKDATIMHQGRQKALQLGPCMRD